MSACISITRAVRKVCNGVDTSAHRLWIANDTTNGGVLLFCARCHGYTSGRARRLGSSCSPAQAKLGAGPTAGRRFWQRLHPQHRGRLTDLKRLDSHAARWFAGRVEHLTRDCPRPEAAVVNINGTPIDRIVVHEEDPDPNSLDGAPSQVSEPDEDVFGWGFGFDDDSQ